ncbi:ArgE/DapE family deacylase [Glaciihabitans sp. UYNi722]|uniref:ArgE/DapE family deacylase n=1 Tax=Glaciihabitans sp. UYNi722 TaxID=3156344 RepID=UPI0033933DB7
MNSLTAAESAILARLDEGQLVESLVNLVAVPSVTGTDAESQLQHDQAASLAEWGLDVDTWALDLEALRAHPAFPGTEAERSEGFGLVASLGGATVPALVLQGHVDVVPTGDLDKWADRNPFSGQIIDGAIHGRGACDMKAGVAANLAVIRTLVASRAVLERPIAIHSVISEEDGGLGAFATMLRGHRGEAAVLPEPTSGRIVTANAGSLTFELRVPGRAAHGSTRLEGVSAIEAFLPLFAAIRVLEAERNIRPDPLFRGQSLPYPISIGRLVSGDWASSVPDLLVAEGRFGVQLGESPDAARKAFERTIEHASATDPWLGDNPPSVAWTGGQFASGQLDDEHPLINQMSSAVTDLAMRSAPARGAAPYGSDLRLYNGFGGIPTLHYGPGDVRFAHAPREQVDIAELISVTRSLLLLAVRRCGAHF